MPEILYLNGGFMPLAEARIDPADRGLTLGDGVFDTLLAVDGVPQDAYEHFHRLLRHAETLEIPVPETPARLAVLAERLVMQNGLASTACAVRTTLTRGPAGRGLLMPGNPNPTLLMRVTSLLNPKPVVSAIIARKTRRNEGSVLSRIKSLNYGDNILALQEARAADADDAILLNNFGNACCLTTANIFAVVDTVWLTPPLENGVLDGITRAKVIGEHHAVEQSLTIDILKSASALYATNSLTGIRPVVLKS